MWYATTHYCALQVRPEQRLVWPLVPWFGLLGCLALFAALPVWKIAIAAAVLAALVAIRWVVQRTMMPMSA